MHAIDLHCDTLMVKYFSSQVPNGFRQPEDIGEPDFLHGKTMVTLDGLASSSAMAQFFAIFMFPAAEYRHRFHVEPLSDEVYFRGCYQVFRQMLARHPDRIVQARCAQDILRNAAQGKLSAVLTVEDGRIVDGKIERVKQLYELGVRAISLTWNEANCFGSPNSADPSIMRRGLTAFGRDAVAYMQQLGILVDVSHLSDGGFYEVASLCKKPFVATHSNCRALAPHPRNLTDDMLKVLGNAGGVVGLNFGPEFLNADAHCRRSTAAQIARHVRHMADVGGIDCVALGSDFDGITGELEISDSSKLPLLEAALRREGFTDGEIEKIACKNVLRVMHDALGV